MPIADGRVCCNAHVSVFGWPEFYLDCSVDTTLPVDYSLPPCGGPSFRVGRPTVDAQDDAETSLWHRLEAAARAGLRTRAVSALAFNSDSAECRQLLGILAELQRG